MKLLGSGVRMIMLVVQQLREASTDQKKLGRLNLLTPTRVAAAAKEIQTGEMVPVKYVVLHPKPVPIIYGDVLELNT